MEGTARSSDTLEALNSNYKQSIASIENLENKYLHQESKAVQLAGAYCIVQSIIYLQTTLSPVTWHPLKRRISLALSAAVSIAFWLTFAITVHDCLRINLQRDVRFKEVDHLYRRMRSFRSGEVPAAAEDQMFDKPLAVLQWKRYVYVGIVNCALLAVTLLVSCVISVRV